MHFSLLGCASAECLTVVVTFDCIAWHSLSPSLSKINFFQLPWCNVPITSNELHLTDFFTLYDGRVDWDINGLRAIHLLSKISIPMKFSLMMWCSTAVSLIWIAIKAWYQLVMIYKRRNEIQSPLRCSALTKSCFYEIRPGSPLQQRTYNWCFTLAQLRVAWHRSCAPHR